MITSGSIKFLFTQSTLNTVRLVGSRPGKESVRLKHTDHILRDAELTNANFVLS